MRWGRLRSVGWWLCGGVGAVVLLWQVFFPLSGIFAAAVRLPLLGLGCALFFVPGLRLVADRITLRRAWAVPLGTGLVMGSLLFDDGIGGLALQSTLVWGLPIAATTGFPIGMGIAHRAWWQVGIGLSAIAGLIVFLVLTWSLVALSFVAVPLFVVGQGCLLWGYLLADGPSPA